MLVFTWAAVSVGISLHVPAPQPLPCSLGRAAVSRSPCMPVMLAKKKKGKVAGADKALEALEAFEANIPAPGAPKDDGMPPVSAKKPKQKKAKKNALSHTSTQSAVRPSRGETVQRPAHALLLEPRRV